MRWQVGSARVTRIVEQDFAIPPATLLANFDERRLAEHARWLEPCFMRNDRQLLMSFQTFLVESCGKRIIVDTCRGNDRPLPKGRGTIQTRYLQDLEQVVARYDVDYVMCTHLHYDHVGWNTMWSQGCWVPTFSRARYLFSREDFEYWATGADDGNVDLQFSVEPIVQAGLHQLVESSHRITDEVVLEPTPGHTPGHVSVRIVSQGEQALITGDFVHHPVQLLEPAWSSKADVDPLLAARTRSRMAEGLLAEGVLIIGTHFSAPTCGHLVRDGASRRFQPCAAEHRIAGGARVPAAGDAA